MATKTLGPNDFRVGETVEFDNRAGYYRVIITALKDDRIIGHFSSTRTHPVTTNNMTGGFFYSEIKPGTLKRCYPTPAVAQTIPVVTVPASKPAVNEELAPGYYVVDWEGSDPFILSVSRIDGVLTYHCCFEDSMAKDHSIKDALTSSMKIRCRLAL